MDTDNNHRQRADSGHGDRILRAARVLAVAENASVVRAMDSKPGFWRGAFSAHSLLDWPGMQAQAAGSFPHGDVTRQVIGAMYDVHRELGYGFSETVYRRAVRVVLHEAGLEVVEEQPITVTFRRIRIGTFYADLVVAGAVLVEVKAASTIQDFAQAQILNYLKAAGGGVGLLLNFGHQATFKRFVMGDPTDSLPVLRRPHS